MRWNQRNVTEWAVRTFGDWGPLSVAVRMNKEFAELLSALAHGRNEEAAKECADLQVMLCQIAEKLGIDLQEEFQKKMDVNEARQWAKGKDGSYQHVEG